MRKIKKTVITLVFSIIFFIGTIGILIWMIPVDKQTENITVFYSGTVSKIQVTHTGEDTYVQISTAEYDTSLYLLPIICKNINVDDVSCLQKGQKIFFRIENFKAYQMNEEVEFINIVSLSTEEKDIFTLDDYNNYIRKSANSARIAAIAVVVLLLLVTVFCAFSIRHKIKQ